MISSYKMGHQLGFNMAQMFDAHVAISQKEAAQALEQLRNAGQAHLVPMNEAIEGFVAGWLVYVQRPRVEHPVAS